MNRRQFVRRAALTAGATFAAPYILPSGRLFATTGSRVANHVVFVLFAGGIRNQESIEKAYLSAQPGFSTSGNIMNNLLNGAAPSSNLVYTPWAPVLGSPLQQQGTLFREMRYEQGPTGHYNGHTVAITGNYTETGLNLNQNPDFPTVFEYYRKHTNPNASALNAWWLSEGLGPYPSLNYSRHPLYGVRYGANYLRGASIFSGLGLQYFGNAVNYQPDDVERINKVRDFLNKNFDRPGIEPIGIQNTPEDRERIKQFILDTITKAQQGQLPLPTPGNNPALLSGDLVNVATAWQVLETFQPELTVINMFNSDICHTNFSGYINFLHQADYAVGWLWNKIQSTPGLANDTVLICMPEHGRNQQGNNLYDANGLAALDHTGDANSRRIFGLIAGPSGKVIPNQTLGTTSNPVGSAIDIVPTIAHVLGFRNDIPGGLLPGTPLLQAFV